jgi:hypothetical protein
LAAAGLPSLPPGTNRHPRAAGGKWDPPPEVGEELGQDQEVEASAPEVEGLQEGLGAALEAPEAQEAVGHRVALQPHQGASQAVLEAFQEDPCREEASPASLAAPPRAARRSCG